MFLLLLNHTYLTNCFIRFLLTDTDDAPKTKSLTQLQKRKMRKVDKDNERASDTLNVRGYSTDQRISIETMNVNIRRLEHQQKESKLVGLSIQVSAIGTQIASAEARATQRCPEYNANNLYWKRVDLLIQQETDVVFTMNKYNNDLLVEDGSRNNVTQISNFLNQESPIKKKPVRVDSGTKDAGDYDIDNAVVAFDMEEQVVSNDDVITIDNAKGDKEEAMDDNDEDNDNDKATYKVKKEKLAKAKTSNKKVSGRNTRSTRRRRRR